MTLPEFIRRRLLRWAVLGVSHSRRPDRYIGATYVNGRPTGTYLERWHVIPRNRWFNIYLHRFLRSDDDRALHDHPWWSCSLILSGGYFEHLEGGGRRWRPRGSILFRGARSAHRVELPPIVYSEPPQVYPAWTLFITGPKLREWGFHCPKGWRHWREFTSGPNGDSVGRGCD